MLEEKESKREMTEEEDEEEEQHEDKGGAGGGRRWRGREARKTFSGHFYVVTSPTNSEPMKP